MMYSEYISILGCLFSLIILNAILFTKLTINDFEDVPEVETLPQRKLWDVVSFHAKSMHSYERSPRNVHARIMENSHKDSNITRGSQLNLEMKSENELKESVKTPFVTPKWQRILDMSSEAYHSFNSTASDLIGNRRELWDTRPSACRSIQYDITALPVTSIISIFHNEARSTLLRTIHSFLERTPSSLLREFILIDDASTHPWLKEPLTDYVKELPKVRLIRLSKRQGLIRARLRGAKEATGEVLYFTDAHTEANVQWLEPLLIRIKENKKVLAVPTIDPIDYKTMAYQRSARVTHGAITWTMVYYYKQLPEYRKKAWNSLTEPFPSPIMVGCAHAISRDYFFETGSYDEDMDIWGGENIEHSFRLWMCGGRVEIIPCSHVGHIFKPRLPFSFKDDAESVIKRNLIRTAEVWMDDFKKYYYAQKDSLPPVDLKSLEKRKQLRRDLRCKSFKWYLDTVVPEMPIPPETAKHYGEVKHVEREKEYCMHYDGDTGRLLLIPCGRQDVSFQQLRIDTNGTFAYKDVHINRPSMFVNVSVSANLSGPWKYESDRIQTEVDNKKLCLQYVPYKEDPGLVTLKLCNESVTEQIFSFMYTFDFSKKWDIEEISRKALEPPSNASYFGQLQNVGSAMCLDVFDDTYYEIIPCPEQKIYKRVLHLDKDSKLIHQKMCLFQSANQDLMALKCTDTNVKTEQKWHYDLSTNQLKVKPSNLCLSHNPRKSEKVVFLKCDVQDLFQKWVFSVRL